MKDDKWHRSNLRCEISESIPKGIFRSVSSLTKAVDEVERKMQKGKSMKQAIKELKR